MTGKQYYSLREGDLLRVTKQFSVEGFTYPKDSILEVVMQEPKSGSIFYYVKDTKGHAACLGAYWLLNYTELTPKQPLGYKYKKAIFEPYLNTNGKPTNIKNTTTDDGVNHPSHYNQGSIECIDALISAHGRQAVIDFCICNAHKYVWRCNDKGNPVQDLNKAQWYINKAIELLNQQHSPNKEPPIKENL